MKTIAIFLLFCAPLIVSAQVNTNIVILSGAGTPAVDATYVYDSAIPSAGFMAGCYTNVLNSSDFLGEVSSAPGYWYADSPDYTSTNFPYTWQTAYGAAPAPIGQYYSATPPPDLWGGFYLTNFWPLPGDYVTYQAAGRNMATSTNMAGLEVLLDSNILYQSTLTAGNGSQFHLDGRMGWDGTNMSWFAEMASGDPSNTQTAVFGELTNYDVGTNEFQIIATGNTNGFILLSATITASRVPQGTVAPAGTNIVAPGAITFKTD